MDRSAFIVLFALLLRLGGEGGRHGHIRGKRVGYCTRAGPNITSFDLLHAAGPITRCSPSLAPMDDLYTAYAISRDFTVHVC